MVSGRLQEKNGYYYMVLSYKDATGKRKQPWYAKPAGEGQGARPRRCCGNYGTVVPACCSSRAFP